VSSKSANSSPKRRAINDFISVDIDSPHDADATAIGSSAFNADSPLDSPDLQSVSKHLSLSDSPSSGENSKTVQVKQQSKFARSHQAKDKEK
jgi:hypothetical protein